MSTFKFELGQIVILDPIGGERGIKGKVITRSENIDGSVSYLVAANSHVEDVVRRHSVMECEIREYEGKSGVTL